MEEVWHSDPDHPNLRWRNVDPEIQAQMPEGELAPWFKSGIDSWIGYIELEKKVLWNKARVIMQETKGDFPVSGLGSWFTTLTHVFEVVIAPDEDYYNFPPSGVFEIVRQ